ncbi:MAG: LytTR family transcriptional regulator [Bacteroidales bacterium]|nr:LytTR family transcriptional regulator [Bacteroidales bacterium]
MTKFKDPLPRYLLESRQIRSTVLFTALFSLLFILLTLPFSGNTWLALSDNEVFLHTVAYVATAVLLVILSRFQMGRCRGMELFTMTAYIIWNAAEVVAVSLLYALFAPDRAEFWRQFFCALPYSAVCLSVPLAFCSLQAALRDRDNTIRLMNYGNVVSDRPAAHYSEQRITLFDNNGVLKFSISPDNLYFIESDDNYIKAWYTDSGGEIKQYMLRCRLKTVEDSFADSELVRCHRKYIVNIRKVSILKSQKEGYKIAFDNDALDPVPISKTYEQAVLARFNSR